MNEAYVQWMRNVLQNVQEYPLPDTSEQECDHKGHWHLCPGSYRIVRFCGGCGKSWWIPARDEALSFAGEVATLEWEPIKEYAEVPPLAASFYDDPRPFEDGYEDDEGIEDED